MNAYEQIAKTAYDLIVIGGGASGYATALYALQHGVKKVLLIEGQEKHLRKVGASGNGRCNLGNTHIDPSCYVGDDITPFLSDNYDLVPTWWRDLGVLTRTDEEGRIYPLSNKASTVVDAILGMANAYHLAVHQDYVEGVYPLIEQRLVAVDTLLKARFWARYVVVAVGSPASPKLGGRDTYDLLFDISHRVERFKPALVALRTTPSFPSLKGTRALCEGDLFEWVESPENTIRDVALRTTGKSPRLVGDIAVGLAHEKGEVLFSEDGISGIMAMQLSNHLTRGNHVSLNFLPDTDEKQVQAMLFSRLHHPAYPTVDKLLMGIVERKLGYALLKVAGISPLDTPCSSLTADKVRALVDALYRLELRIDGTATLSDAQVAKGGVSLKALIPETMQLREYPMVYVVGEAINVAGMCGGYNLHWAWLSGLKAARHIVAHLA